MNENENEAVDEVAESEDTVQAQEEKPKFTQKQQEEVNRLLAKERKSVETKSRQSLEKAQSEWATAEQSLRSQIAEYESGLEAVIKVQTADFDPLVLSLLADKPILEQWRKLQDAEFVTAARRKNVPPKTPNTPENTNHKVKQVGFGQRQF